MDLTALLASPYLWVVLGLLLLPLIRRQFVKQDITGKTVFVTGGSEGIGKAFAEDFARRGCNVVIFARTVAKLEAAVADIKKHCKDAKAQKIGYQSIDVTDADKTREGIQEAAKAYGTPDILVSSAGAAHPGYFLDQDASVFEKTMRLNYMGNVHVLKAVAPMMVARGEGHMMIVASAAAVVSFVGYASYAPTKFALRGLADTLRNELSGFGVKVHICYPPDTDTPGFKKENEAKPVETLACANFPPFKPEDVAGQSIYSMLAGDYHIQSPDLLQNLLISSMSGVTPRAFFFLELLLQPILALVQAPFYMWFDYQARCYAAKKKKQD